MGIQMSSPSCQFPILYDCSIFAGVLDPPNVHLSLLSCRIGCQVKPFSQNLIYPSFLKYHSGREEEKERPFIEHQVF